ncbi:MAG: hypothetical protein OEY23_09245 [Acidimicrobiia bacterium]|nr:hypothetical protein [Acidimicrobiia bacterium]
MAALVLTTTVTSPTRVAPQATELATGLGDPPSPEVRSEPARKAGPVSPDPDDGPPPPSGSGLDGQEPDPAAVDEHSGGGGPVEVAAADVATAQRVAAEAASAARAADTGRDPVAAATPRAIESLDPTPIGSTVALDPSILTSVAPQPVSPPATQPPPSAPPPPAASGYGPCQVTWADSRWSAWSLDTAFYAKGCIVDGLPILSSAKVDSRALGNAARTATAMLAQRPDLWNLLVERGLRIGVIARTENAVDLPEYRDLPVRFPGVDWSGARAYSATLARPLLAAPEENLACHADDTYPGQQVLVHELGHTVVDLAVRYQDRTFWPRVEAAYQSAIQSGLWVGYYGSSSAVEYWAEGVQAYFDAAVASAHPNGTNSPVATRDQLAAYDPGLHALVAAVFGDVAWRAGCP